MRWINKALPILIMMVFATVMITGCGTDDIDISGYMDEEIVIEGIAEDAVSVSIAELKEMDCISIKTESTSDKIGKVKATGPTLETVLANKGQDISNVRKITFHGTDDYSYSLLEDYIAEHDIILAFGIDGEPLGEEDVPCRIIIPESDSAYWLRMLDKITIEMK
jgi:DMSO/TMAO reductase YedYZ molybdopterin-dependent catalytic subunit